MTTQLKTFGLALAMAATVFGAVPAHAQSNCAPREAIVERLQDGYGEALTAGGLQSALQILEIWASAETGTWTLLATRADGTACVIASGTDWQQHEPVLALMGVDS